MKLTIGLVSCRAQLLILSTVCRFARILFQNFRPKIEKGSLMTQWVARKKAKDNFNLLWCVLVDLFLRFNFILWFSNLKQSKHFWRPVLRPLMDKKDCSAFLGACLSCRIVYVLNTCGLFPCKQQPSELSKYARDQSDSQMWNEMRGRY